MGKPHTPSHPCMMPIWPCWVREMSEARSLTAVTFGPVAHDLGHLDGLAVVDDHVAGEAGLRGVVTGRYGGEQHRQRHARRKDGRDGEQQ